MTLWELLPEHGGTAFERELHRAMREQKLVEFEAYSEPTGRWLGVRAYPTAEGLVGYSHDISERKRGRGGAGPSGRAAGARRRARAAGVGER